MNPAQSQSVTYWKYLFVGVQALVWISVVTYVLAWPELRRLMEHLVSPWQYSLMMSCLVAGLFLLLGSPFLLRSLRGMALTGWLSGVVSLGVFGYLTVTRFF